MKPSKKAFLFVVLILYGRAPAATAAPVKHNPETHGLEQYRLLLTSNCNYRDLIMSETCQTNEKMMNTYIEYCGFADLCDSGFKPVCVNGDGGGMLHICSPKNLTCPKGYRRRAWLNGADSDIVLTQEEKCPQGRYQSSESNCYDACVDRYKDIKELPTQYAMYSKGDNISPPWIYCDFEKGFYNMDGKFLLEYDEEFIYHPFFCTSVSDVNPCASGEYPLPNGTCVLPCKEEIKRDAYDDFKCKVHNESELVSSTEGNEGIVELQGYSPTLSKTSETYKGLNTINQTTQSQWHYNEAVDSQDLKDWHIVLIIVLVGAALLATIIGLVIQVFQRQNTPKIVKISHENKTEKKTVIHKAASVNIFSYKDNNVQPFIEGAKEGEPFIC